MHFQHSSFSHSDFTLIDGIHRLFKSSSCSVLEDIQNCLLDQISEHLNESVETLQILHKHLSVHKINPIRVNLFNVLNSGVYRWPEIINLLCADHIAHVMGPDYVIQKKVNLSIQMPEDESSTLPMHSDCISGDSPWQMNLWIPLTRALGTSSMYLVSMAESIRVFEKLNVLKGLGKHTLAGYKEVAELMEDCQKTFIDAEFGQILLFHPGVLHGNQTNTTDYTRVSLNIRLKSLFTPDSSHNNPDRSLGSYYELANQSKQSAFSQTLSEYFG